MKQYTQVQRKIMLRRMRKKCTINDPYIIAQARTFCSLFDKKKFMHFLTILYYNINNATLDVKCKLTFFNMKVSCYQLMSSTSEF